MQELTIIKKIEDMIGYGYLCVRYFPKSERFVMGADIRESMLNMLSIAIGAANKKKLNCQNAKKNQKAALAIFKS